MKTLVDFLMSPNTRALGAEPDPEPTQQSSAPAEVSTAVASLPSRCGSKIDLGDFYDE